MTKLKYDFSGLCRNLSPAYEPKGRGFESLQARGNKVRICQAKSGLFYAFKLDSHGFHQVLLKSIHSESNGFLCVYDGL